MRNNNMLKPHPVRPSSNSSRRHVGSESSLEHSVYTADSEQQQQTGSPAEHEQHEPQEEAGMSIGSPSTPAGQTIHDDDEEVEGEKSTRIIKSPGTPSAKERQ